MPTQQNLLGATIKRFRERKGMTQYAVAQRMRWRGTAPVVEIEKGRRIPRQDTLRDLGKCLGLNDPDVKYLYGLARACAKSV